MNSNLQRLENDIEHLSLSEQTWLLERLAHLIRANTARQVHMVQDQLAAMADDPEIQQEIRIISSEFVQTELDGLADEE